MDDNLNEMVTGDVKSNVENLELYSDNYPFRLSLRIKNFENETEFNKFIKAVERMVRGSIEYRYWRDYIKDVLHINTCVITNERMDEVTVEVHHHIPSLFILIKALILKEIDRDQEFSSFDMALKAIELHYANKIGYTTLIKSMHEKFHNGFLSIPISVIRGDYQYFIKEYSQYLDDEDLEKINYRLAINENNCGWSRDNYVIGEATQGG